MQCARSPAYRTGSDTPFLESTELPVDLARRDPIAMGKAIARGARHPLISAVEIQGDHINLLNSFHLAESCRSIFIVSVCYQDPPAGTCDLGQSGAHVLAA